MEPKPGMDDQRLRRFWALLASGETTGGWASTGDEGMSSGVCAWVLLVLEDEPVVLGEL